MHQGSQGPHPLSCRRMHMCKMCASVRRARVGFREPPCLTSCPWPNGGRIFKKTALRRGLLARREPIPHPHGQEFLSAHVFSKKLSRFSGSQKRSLSRASGTVSSCYAFRNVPHDAFTAIQSKRLHGVIQLLTHGKVHLVASTPDCPYTALLGRH